jgi:hypothetical protein
MKHSTTHRLRPPSRRERLWLAFATRARAKREARSPRPFTRTGVGSEPVTAPAAYQLLPVEALGRWLEALATATAARLSVLDARRCTLERDAEGVARAITDLRPSVRPTLRFGGVSAGTVVVLALASILGLVATWPFMEQQGWPFPVTALAAVAVAAVDVVVAAACGATIAALVLDEPRCPFTLTPRQRVSVKTLAICFGVLMVVLVTALAWDRGAGGSGRVLWLALGFITAALGVYAGLAVFEARFQIELAGLVRRHRDLRARIDDERARRASVARAALAAGRTYRSYAAEILRRGDVAFEGEWRRRHYGESGALAPGIPRVALPADVDLAVLLTAGDDGADAPERKHPAVIALDAAPADALQAGRA